jgi:hypothetical protein
MVLTDKTANPKIAMRRKLGNEWQLQVKIEQISKIMHGHKQSLTYAHNHSSHSFLVFKIPDMLEHGIAVDNIEVFIWQMQRFCISNNDFNL